jgi:primosomal protein N' (replication factor Y)
MAKKAADIHTDRLWVEEGEQREGPVAEVAPVVRTHRTYTFAVPEALEASLTVGQRVVVPFGRAGRSVHGFVVALGRTVWDSTLRPIDSVLDEGSFLTPELIELGREIALHYACPLGQTLKAFTPTSVRRASGLKSVRYARLLRLPSADDPAGIPAGPKQRALIDAFLEREGPVAVHELLDQASASNSTLRALVKDGWVEVTTRKELSDEAEPSVALEEPEFELTEEQESTLASIRERIDTGGFSVTLLFGVSGSGKTEVYIRSIRRALQHGKQAILLVPEIVLTTQLVQRLASRFADVAVSHSGLTDAQRSVIWRKVASGEKKVVIGTRSAVFAACPNLGIICVDEEQETSFKNLQAPRFNVRDVAIMRAKQIGIPVVLGSATPSVEMWYHSEHRPEYRRSVMRHRVRDLPMPTINVVDMREEFIERKRIVVLSRLMERLLAETLDRGEQALLLMNRRGFARRLYCPVCSTSINCPNCNVGLVVHRVGGQAMCHYCRNRVTTPTMCPNVTCGEPLVQVGSGTQRVEDVLAELFPESQIKRVDSDTMKRREQYEQIVHDFGARKIDVLVGTQMIAKGLDFPFVSFVGVVHADASGLASDFRASERLFQLITQVAGRAGRADASGRVVVQTTTPELPALRHALAHDYESFAADELPIRKQAALPPFRRLARIVVADRREGTARGEAEAIAGRVLDSLRSLSLSHSDVLGPNPCVLARLRGKYRYDLLVRTANATMLRELLAHLEELRALHSKADSILIDVDPVALT